jgi:hypothetical protein
MSLAEHAHVNRMSGAAREVARRADALQLPRLNTDPVARVYDAGDGARLHEALAPR